MEKGEYVKRKEELIKTKVDLNKRKEDFGQKGAFWLEPLKGWVKAANGAGKIALSEDNNQIKAIIEKVGTNRILRAKKIEFDFVQPYTEVAKLKGLKETSPAVAGLVLGDSGGESPAWYPGRDLNPYGREATGFSYSLQLSLLPVNRNL
ncbi:MAG: hypothetical protein HYU69_06330 [Bacteroidetes bacterium]|nr:hypothetical protein [Bacteroidota bacterium]